jgi:hypothetical protein
MKNHEDPDISRIIKQPTFLLCDLKETEDVSHCDNLVKYKILLEINNNNLLKIPLGAESIFLIFPGGYWYWDVISINNKLTTLRIIL